MNKNYYLVLIAAVALISTPALILAQNNDDRKGPKGTIGAKIMDDYNKRVESTKNNRDDRNVMLAASSSTRSIKSPQNDNRGKDDKGKGQIWNASTTLASTSLMMREVEKVRKEKRNDMRADVYMFQKNNIVRQLEQALGNLKQIRERIAARITKAEQSGRNMTNAKALLVTADAKILVAKQSIDAIKAFNPGAINASTTVAASSTVPVIVNLNQARILANTSKDALKSAKNALNDVVVAIAKAMGLKLGQPKVTPNASTTPSVSPTASSTPSVTPTVSPSASTTPAVTITPSVTPTVTPTITPTITPTVTPSVTPTTTPTVTPTATPTITPTPTP